MERHFEIELRNLKAELVAMAGLVERAIEIATQALLERNSSELKQVYEIEKRVNQSHKSVDEHCLKLLALQQPLAADLRLVLAVIKINTDLERMGDQAVNIAHNSEFYLSGEPFKPLEHLPIMAAEVRVMVREALDAFVKKDDAMAVKVLKRDDLVDGLKRQIFQDCTAKMKANPAGIDAGLALILIARNLEKLGDHATNIAEDVIFAISGEDIRHAGHNRK